MIDHLEANLNLIISEPDNIAARLVYADQFDEAGESERAEFIRGQIAGLNCDDLLRVNEWKWTLKFLRRLRVECTWQNGFIEEITVPTIADWIGKPCNHEQRMHLEFPCPDCNGLGYIGGIGWKAVRQTPVRGVKVTDRRPAEVEFGQFYGWHTEEGLPERRYSLPLSIWRLLSGWDQNDPPDTDDGWKWYESEDAAYAALSRAMIEFVGGCAKQRGIQ